MNLISTQVIEKMESILKNVNNLLGQAEGLGHSVETLTIPEQKLETYWKQVKAMEGEQQVLKELRRQLPLHGMAEHELQATLGKAAQVLLSSSKPQGGQMVWANGLRGVLLLGA